MNDGPSWQQLYELDALEEVDARFVGSRDPAWLSVGRAIGRQLGRQEAVAGSHRPEVGPAPLPPATVFVLGATGGGDSGVDGRGCLGHVAADGSGGLLAAGEVSVAGAPVRDAGVVLAAVRDAIVTELRGLDAGVRAPGLELVVPCAGEGDSHALAAGLAALHGIWGEPVASGLAATGGFDVGRGCFTPVPESTLASKVAAARRWGLRTLVVLDTQALPAGLELGPVELVRVSADPAVLSLAVLDLARHRPGELSRTLLHQALWLYDVRVARSPGTSVESVFAATDAFLPDADEPAEDLVCPEKADPIGWLLASDLRSRALVHAGRSVEAAGWSAVGRTAWGRGDLPAGGLGDLLRYQRVAHESIIEVDLARVDEDGPGLPHHALDRTIERLDATWCTQHERLHRLFLGNTRWRRRLHVARRDGDHRALAAATRDLIHDRERWPELLTEHARRGLGMADTDLPRQHNYLLEHLSTTRLLSASAEGTLDGVPLRPDAAAAGSVLEVADPSLRADLEARADSVSSLSGFDLRGLIQAGWLGWDAGSDLWTAIGDRMAWLADRRIDDAVRVADWLIRFDAIDSAASEAILERGIETLRRHAVKGGVRSLVGLRWAALLLWRRGESIDPSRLRDMIPRPTAAASLAAAYEDLCGRPSALCVRTPY